MEPHLFLAQHEAERRRQAFRCPAAAIDRKWGRFDALKEAFTRNAVGNFGSVLTTDDKALLTIGVWEHARYIDCRNAPPKFVEVFLASLANREFAGNNFA